MPVLWIVAGDEIVQVTALEGVFLEREMQIRPQVVNPELLWGEEPPLMLTRFAPGLSRTKRSCRRERPTLGLKLRLENTFRSNLAYVHAGFPGAISG